MVKQYPPETMNNQLIAKVINLNDKSNPGFVYANPLLDRNTARAVAKSFVKILSISRRNSNVSSNLRHCVLENIRRLCQAEAEGHKILDDNLLQMLTEAYDSHIGESSNNQEDSIDKKLDAFLIRKMNDMDLNSSHQPDLNPEVIQALLNLNTHGVYIEKLSEDIIHWNNKSESYYNLIKDLWANDEAMDILLGRAVDDVALKMKVDLERTILEASLFLLTNKEADINGYLTTDNTMLHLIKRCSASIECFQITIAILNFVFITTNFDSRIHDLVFTFVRQVKSKLLPHEFVILYPRHLSFMANILDIDVQTLPSPFKETYMKKPLEILKQLHKDSEHDLILILSHFPQWFDIYFSS